MKAFKDVSAGKRLEVLKYLLALQAAAGLDLQVFGHESGGDGVHRAAVRLEHPERLVTILVEGKHLSAE